MAYLTDAEVEAERHKSFVPRGYFLIAASAMILGSHVVDRLQAGGASWSAFALRLGWCALLGANALALFRGQGVAIRVWSILAGLGSAFFFLALLLVTGGSTSPLFSFTYVLVMLLPAQMFELIRVALVAGAVLLAGSWGLLLSDGARGAALWGWVHIGIAAYGLAWLLGTNLRRVIATERAATRERQQALDALREAQASVRVLAGLLPICAFCKKIRNDGGYWEQLEAYVSAHSEARFSHSFCPDCVRANYPEQVEG